jgi:hypothetical protein
MLQSLTAIIFVSVGEIISVDVSFTIADLNRAAWIVFA